MKLKLNKKKLKNLSNDITELPREMTPNIAGGGDFINPNFSDKCTVNNQCLGATKAFNHSGCGDCTE